MNEPICVGRNAHPLGTPPFRRPIENGGVRNPTRYAPGAGIGRFHPTCSLETVESATQADSTLHDCYLIPVKSATEADSTLRAD